MIHMLKQGFHICMRSSLSLFETAKLTKQEKPCTSVYEQACLFLMWDDRNSSLRHLRRAF